MSWQVVPEREVAVCYAHLPKTALQAASWYKWGSLKGAPATVVSHDYATYRSLQKNGLLVPHPVYYYYDWPGPYTPLDSQRHTVAFLTSHERAFCLNSLGCVDATTEYLAPDGWRRIDDYDGGQVAQYDPNTGEVSFVQSPQYVKLPCEDMIRVKTRAGIDQLLSPEHRVLLSARNNPEKGEVVFALELLRRHDAHLEGHKLRKSRDRVGYSQAIVPTTFRIEREGMDLDEPSMRLQIAVMADGYFPNKGTTAIVRLKRTDKKARLVRLLEAAGVPYKRKDIPKDTHRSDPGFSIFSFAAPRREKVFTGDWWRANEDQRRIIADEVLRWDATPRKGGAAAFFSRSSASADFVQYVFVSLGYTARVTVQERTGGMDYVVHVRNSGRGLSLVGTHADGTPVQAMWWEPSPDGYKYCFMVPTGFLVLRRNGCVFLSGNTGKSLAAIWGTDYLMQAGAVRRAMVVAPLSICDHVWERELLMSLPHRVSRVLRGTRQSKQRVARDTRVEILVVNPESLHLVVDQIPQVDLIVVDEFTRFKNARSKRYKALKAISRRTKLWLMSGTPAPQAPTDAYGPITLVRPEKLTFTRWRDLTMEKVSEFKWVPKQGAEDLIARWMQPAIRYSREECYDLPDVQTVPLQVDQTREQKEAIQSFQDEAAAQFHEDGEVITAANAAAVLSKTLQVLGGGVYGTNADGERYVQKVDASPFFEAIEDTVEQADTPVLVFTSFRSCASAIRDHLASAGYRVGLVASGVPQSERNNLFDRVQSGDLDALVAVASTMSHGLTLTGARYVLWATPPYSYEEYDQANGRVVRRGQNNSVVIYHMIQHRVARDLFNRLESKARIQDTVLSFIGAKT